MGILVLFTKNMKGDNAGLLLQEQQKLSSDNLVFIFFNRKQEKLHALTCQSLTSYLDCPPSLPPYNIKAKYCNIWSYGLCEPLFIILYSSAISKELPNQPCHH